ncbi:hypothetical protein [Rhodopila sp.]|uniref:hypothetical protein n=1 Tax=Rhodopila sp. TaxID=2480087 RepID=UPI003D134FEA
MTMEEKFESELHRAIHRKIIQAKHARNLHPLSLGMPPGKKLADYALFAGRVILEHKAYLHTPDHDKKGRALNAFFESMIAKYHIPREQVPNFRERISLDEQKKLRKLEDGFYHKLQAKINACNNQIRDTKKFLGVPNAIGVAFITFDRVSWIIPGIVAQRSWRSLPNLRHTDFAIAAIRTPDFNRVSIQYMGPTDMDPKHQSALRDVLDVMAVGTRRKRYDLYTAMRMEWEGQI